MKKVLIITYYWIPSGGAGVQRWVKFTKYLRNFGCEPVIYTPENPEYPSVDNSFENDIPDDVQIIKKPIWEPYNIYRNLTGRKGERINAGFISENKKQSFKDKLSIWIRGNFLIPDPRKYWIRPSVKFLSGFIKENNIDTVITTGPPHSMHMIGLGLKRKNSSLKWIADFRDPWTNIDFYKDLNLTFIADAVHHKFERNVIKEADAVLVVSNGMYNDYVSLKPKQIHVIPNGYDESDVAINNVLLDKKFTISHIGTLNAARNPKVLWTVLSDLCQEKIDFQKDLLIQLVGKIDYSVLEDIQNNELQNNLLKIEYLSHADAIKKQQESQLLLLLINNTLNAKGILTGKFYEYLAARRPILAIGPTDGDAARVLKESGAGEMVDFNDYNFLKKVLLDFYKKYKDGQLLVASNAVDRFSRRSLTGDLVNILNKL